MVMIVPDSWAIPNQLRERFGAGAGRQRAMYADGHLLLVLHEPPRASARFRSGFIIWRDPNGIWTWSKDGSVSSLLNRHLAEFSTLFEHLEKELHLAVRAEHYFSLLQRIMPLQRTSRHLHAALQQAREMVPSDHDIITARDTAADIERAFELLYLDAKNGLDYTVAQKAEAQSRSSYEMSVSAHRLNLLAAMFFPITAISSLLGMNVSNGFESFAATSLFWMVLGIGLASGLLLMRVIDHRPASKAFEEEERRLQAKERRTAKLRVRRS